MRQICVLDFKLWKSLPIKELTAQAWNHKGTTPAVTTFIERFNDVSRFFFLWFLILKMSYWVVTELVLCPNFKKRVTVLKRFINLLELAKEQRNFNSVMAILSGLNHGCVSRLKQTWAVCEFVL